MISRRPLNVDDWLCHAIPIETCEYESRMASTQSDRHDTVRPPIDQARVAEAMKRWSTFGTQSGNGDREMFTLSQELKRANLPFHEAEVMLLQAAQSANTPRDRFVQAKKIMRKMQRSWPIL